MGRFIDVSGRRFGMLLAVAYLGRVKKRSMWLCVCDCGAESHVESYDLRSGHSSSCGCNIPAATSLTHTTHGMSSSPEYAVWAGIIKRCTDENSGDFPSYGGRGVAVCSRWLSFESFFSDMGFRPSGDHQIDRINNDGNYEPGNCRWVLRSTNCRNRRSNRTIETPGGPMLIVEASEKYGVSVPVIRKRLLLGWPVDRLFVKPRPFVKTLPQR